MTGQLRVSLKAAWQQLRFDIDGKKARAGVDVFVAGQWRASKGDKAMTLDISHGSQQNADMNDFFLHLRWASR